MNEQNAGNPLHSWIYILTWREGLEYVKEADIPRGLLLVIYSKEGLPLPLEVLSGSV